MAMTKPSQSRAHKAMKMRVATELSITKNEAYGEILGFILGDGIVTSPSSLKSIQLRELSRLLM